MWNLPRGAAGACRIGVDVAKSEMLVRREVQVGDLSVLARWSQEVGWSQRR